MSTRQKISLVILVVSLFLPAIAAVANAKVIYVDDDANGTDNGTNWANAYPYLQDALDDAYFSAKPVEIRVAQGIYMPDEDDGGNVTLGDREATFQLINHVTITGGYAGSGISDPDAWDVRFYETILSGDLDGNDVQVSDPCDLLSEPTRSENSYHVVTGNGTYTTAVLDGFTITAGNAYDNSDPSVSSGGGMRSIDGSPVVINCTFTKNCAYSGGGGVAGNELTLVNCTFSYNYANEMGGGVSAMYDSILTNCTFSENLAGNIGGGVWQGLGNPRLTNCTFSGNSAGTDGGGLYLSFSYVTLTNCIFWGNTAASGPQFTVNPFDTITTSYISYSDVEDGPSGVSAEAGNLNWGSGNIDSDPNFVNASSGDCHLRWSSDCINAGNPSFLFNANERDFDGEPRVMVGRIDMGADEVGEKQADFTRNGRIDSEDLGIFVQSWLTSPIDIDWYVLCDLYEDDGINLVDYADFVADYLWEASWHGP